VKTPRFGEWLQIGVSTSVLAGVILVGWELKQNNELAAHERISEVFQLWGEIYRFEYENDVKLLYKKSIETPQDLTDGEVLRLDIWLNLVMETVVLNDVQNRLHGLQGNPTDQAALYADYYFTGEFSRAWFAESKEWYVEAPELMEKIQEEIDKRPASSEFDLLKQLRSY